MTALIAKCRDMIGDPAGASQQFDDQRIQDALDDTRDDIRYELLTAAPSLVNAVSTNNLPEVVWADYFSTYHWWETDVLLQGLNTTTQAAWVVLTPLASDYIVGHWQFELNAITTGTAPGQYPPVFATGKTYDLHAAAADLLEWWAASLARSYDFNTAGASFRRSQMQAGLLKQAEYYRERTRPRRIRALRSDVASATGGHSERVPLLGENDDFLR